MITVLKDLLIFIIGAVETILTFRFVLKLFAANPSSQIVDWIYHTSAPLLQPFTLAFPTPTVRGGFTLEFTTLFAIFAYAFAGFLIQELLEILESGTSRKR